MSLQLITFDLDDTLWDVAPAIETAEVELRRWMAEHTPRVGPLPHEELLAIRSALLEQEPGLKHRISELRRRMLLQVVQDAGYTAQAEQLADSAFEVFLHARHQLDLFSDVHSTLSELSQHFQLAVITNGNADVRRIGLAHYFQFALCAEDLGVGKPDPQPFNEALRRAGVAAERALHIGDHPEDDIAGAQRAGLNTVWFNPQGKDWTAAHQPDAQVQRLAQLPELLRNWR
ncbi:HAD family hydrolase [Pseudomonas sp. 5P_3.1_Bac2]|uniref:HAD family hydrolase n=1 Tax=Pseudomonas sp. 5P_3.1_Bac2 TaxID=2971617 RepID=UPI0021C89BA0|nr:HAD-IA family hydrolase [Pseudomonas sp. 5P_3.1_Bac2]MCU1718024.1 HAD-IA family hydrolase [Pseudomonas sp. 5P_3.1_Bac2]